jgi:hypothetical protein
MKQANVRKGSQELWATANTCHGVFARLISDVGYRNSNCNLQLSIQVVCVDK